MSIISCNNPFCIEYNVEEVGSCNRLLDWNIVARCPVYKAFQILLKEISNETKIRFRQ